MGRGGTGRCALRGRRRGLCGGSGGGGAWWSRGGGWLRDGVEELVSACRCVGTVRVREREDGDVGGLENVNVLEAECCWHLEGDLACG